MTCSVPNASIRRGQPTGSRALRGRATAPWLAILFITVGVSWPGVARAQQAATLVPADTSTYIEVNHLAELRRELADDPVVQTLLIDPLKPGSHADHVWSRIEQAMQMPRGEIFDRYFGKRLVIASPADATDQREGALISTVTADDAQIAITRLGLTLRAQADELTIYDTGDGTGQVTFGRELMIFSKPQSPYAAQAVKVIGGKAPALSSDVDFLTWSRRLPEGGDVFVYHRNENEHHAATIRREDRGISIDYAGDFPQGNAVAALLGGATGRQFGPIPDSALAAVSFNLHSTDVDSRIAQRLDGLLAPRTLAGDVLPKLQAPIVLAVSNLQVPALDGSAVDEWPVAALAVRMRDTAVAEDLDRILNSIVAMANAASASNGGPPIASELVQEGECTFRIAEFGTVLAARLNRPHLKDSVRLSYGAVGQWYILATHDTLFRQCVEASEGRRPSLIDSPQVKPLEIADAPRPIFTAIIRSRQAAPLLGDLARQLQSARPDAADSDPLKWMRFASGLMKGYEAASVQVSEPDDDEPGVRARVRLLYPPAE